MTWILMKIDGVVGMAVATEDAFETAYKEKGWTEVERSSDLGKLQYLAEQSTSAPDTEEEPHQPRRRSN